MPPGLNKATLQAMKILGGQFVFGRTIQEALKRGQEVIVQVLKEGASRRRFSRCPTEFFHKNSVRIHECAR